MVGWGHGYRDPLVPPSMTSRPPTPEQQPTGPDQLILRESRRRDLRRPAARIDLRLRSRHALSGRHLDPPEPPSGRSTASAPGFAAFVAVDAQDRIRGLTYGYTGRPGQWWFSEVARGLGRADSPWLANYLELTELHVRPDSQGAGIGEALLTALLTNRT